MKIKKKIENAQKIEF